MFADGNDTNERPGLEELYELATNASNLKQEPERRTAADTLRDMAMSTDRLGAALRRLRGQWEAVEKPTRQRTRSVKEWQAILPVRPEGKYEIRDDLGNVELVTRARAVEYANAEERERHDRWYETEMQRLVGQLTELPAVRNAVAVQAVKWGIQDAEDKAGAVVRYWLDQNCGGCDGTKWEVVHSTNRHGTKVCKVCRGSGVAQVPFGQEGRRLANHMDQCLYRHWQTLKARRKAFGSIPAIDRLAKLAQPSDESD